MVSTRMSRDMPDYRAVIAADIKDFTGNTGTGFRMLAQRLPQVLSEAFARSGLDFSRARFPSQAGDSYAAGVDARQLSRLIYPLLDHLQAILAEYDAEFRAHDRGLRMRLRVSVHVGPLPDDDPTEPSGIGKAMNDVHRLLDADQVRDALRHTDPDTTFVAAVISQRAYEDAIQTGDCALPASLLIPIHAVVKQFTGDAWLYVPELSGQALRRAFVCGDYTEAARSLAGHVTSRPGSATDTMASGTASPKFHIGTAGQVADTVTGPVTIRQFIRGGAELAAKQGELSQPGVHDSLPLPRSSGESS